MTAEPWWSPSEVCKVCTERSEVLTEISMAEHAAGRPLVELRRREDGYSPSGQGLRSDGETSESARSIEPSDVLEDAARPRLEARVDAALATLP